ncbi:restriction endonuclease subunit S [Bacillus cereus group sp. Bc177]|uniref:restriction endonuclease subunit S n=1 Tax=Bacillus cereus group sp. Bc177 TaxID=3018114 RepID=UPI0022E3A642|nr:restriction endonuclease subunit S [Bacillus cereus group sp. Bc177]MDA2323953.1 restriction endonuclease subunit S [Bacillus cereus group sp. Bc177]
MKLNYKRIGDCIQLVDDRNIDGSVKKLLGLSISKEFIPSVANTVGTNMKNYKIIRRNQFACSTMQVRRDRKMPIALYTDTDEAIISAAYPVFEVVDTEHILPEYLMMWFRRTEFDREACFYAIGGVRGSIEWEDFCNMELPVPPITKQKEIVSEYNVLVDRINLNNLLIQKLEETTYALYKQWFVDFEFPAEKDKPYKSNGGEMEFNKDLNKEIPRGWRNGTLNDIADIIDGDRGPNYPSLEDMQKKGFCLFLNAGNVSKTGFNFTENNFISKEKDEALRKGKLVRNDVVMTSRGTVGNLAYYSDAITFNDIRINSGMVILRAKEFVEGTFFLYTMLRSTDMKKEIENYLSGSAQPQLPIKDLVKIPILIPDKEVLFIFSKIGLKLQKYIDTTNTQNIKLAEFQDILLSKLVTLGDSQ